MLRSLRTGCSAGTAAAHPPGKSATLCAPDLPPPSSAPFSTPTGAPAFAPAFAHAASILQVLLDAVEAPEPGAGPMATEGAGAGQGDSAAAADGADGGASSGCAVGAAGASVGGGRRHADPAELPIPPHVVINHLYNTTTTSTGDGPSAAGAAAQQGGAGRKVMAVTVRFRDGKYGDKFASQVFYTACTGGCCVDSHTAGPAAGAASPKPS